MKISSGGRSGAALELDSSAQGSRIGARGWRRPAVPRRLAGAAGVSACAAGGGVGVGAAAGGTDGSDPLGGGCDARAGGSVAPVRWDGGGAAGDEVACMEIQGWVPIGGRAGGGAEGWDGGAAGSGETCAPGGGPDIGAWGGTDG